MAERLVEQYHNKMKILHSCDRNEVMAEKQTRPDKLNANREHLEIPPETYAKVQTRTIAHTLTNLEME